MQEFLKFSIAGLFDEDDPIKWLDLERSSAFHAPEHDNIDFCQHDISVQFWFQLLSF